MTDSTKTLQTASECHRMGDAGEAERICRELLLEDPENGRALHLLGMLRFEQGDYESAGAFLERAIAAGPANYVYYYNLAEAYRCFGRFADAVLCYEKSITLNPGFGEARNNMGIVLQELGLIDAAIRSYREALELIPDSQETLMNLGSALAGSARPDDAVQCFERVTLLKPEFVEAYAGLCDTLLKTGKLGKGIARYRQTIKKDPRAPAILNCLGHALMERGCLEEASRAFSLSVRRNPSFAEGYLGLGIARRRSGRLEEARDCFEKALALNPELVEAHRGLGALCYELGMFIEAKAHYQKVLDLRDADPSAYLNLGMLLADEGFLSEAASCYAKGDVYPYNVTAKVRTALLMPVIPGSVEEIEEIRKNLKTNIKSLRGQGLLVHDPLQQIGKANFFLAYHGLNDLAIQKELAGFYEEICPSLGFVAPHCHTGYKRPEAAKIRIGFVSRHLRRHTVGHYLRGIMEHLDRDIFEVHTFTFPHRNEEIAAFIEEHSDRVTMLPESFADARLIIAGAKLDILFYPDIGMEPFTYFLAFGRLAPVQCVFYGHPVTTGIKNMDYFISHEDCEPEDGDAHYCEKLVRLTRNAAYAYFYKPLVGEQRKTRADFGIDESARLYLCCQSLFKVHPDFDGIVKGILERDERGVVAFFHGIHANWADLLRKRFHETLKEKADRVRFFPRQPYDDYLDLIALADVILDTVHFSGGATAFDALAIGTPVVTIPGAFMRGRQTYSLYKRMDIMDCVAHTPEDYIRIAVRVASDPCCREDIKSRILARHSMIFEDPGMVRDLEQKLLAMVDRVRPGAF